MRFLAVAIVLTLVGCGDNRAAPPPPDPQADPDDPAVVCRELSPALAAMATLIDDAAAIPKDPALYLLAARLAEAERELGVGEAELAIVEREQGAPDYVLRPPRYRELRERERLRLVAAVNQATAAVATVRAEAAASSYPALALADGAATVLSSIRWRDAAAQVHATQRACAAPAPDLDGAAARDLISGLEMVEGDAHGVGNRALERALLAGDDLTEALP